ncbi:MAG: hypothetical protein COB29_00965 [Sulfitobacter sp.]|nr:MAG: hypothetical protein COB29_00965 [Sulfitobacter sp.]
MRLFLRANLSELLGQGIRMREQFQDLSPFSLLFIDLLPNTEGPQYQGTEQLMFIVDFKTTNFFTDELQSKTQSYASLRKFISNYGLHKRTDIVILLASDQDPTLRAAAEKVCREAGIGYLPLPPGASRFNFAESSSRILVDLAVKYMIQGKFSRRFWMRVLARSAFYHNNTASTSQLRESRPPSMLIHGVIDMRRLTELGVEGFVLRKSRTDILANESKRTRSHPAKFFGIPDPRNPHCAEVYVHATRRFRLSREYSFKHGDFKRKQINLPDEFDYESSSASSDTDADDEDFDPHFGIVPVEDRIIDLSRQPGDEQIRGAEGTESQDSEIDFDHLSNGDDCDTHEGINFDESDGSESLNNDANTPEIIIEHQNLPPLNHPANQQLDDNVSDSPAQIDDILLEESAVPFQPEPVSPPPPPTPPPPSHRYPLRSRELPQEIFDSVSNLLSEHKFVGLGTKDSSNNFYAALDISLRLARQAVTNEKDLPWKPMLFGPHRSEALKAYEREIRNIEEKCLTEISPDHPEFQTAVKEAIGTRMLLSKRRNGELKARLVKQGCFEPTDPDMDVYADLARFSSIRMLLCRSNSSVSSQHRITALIDFVTAYLQSDAFAPGEKPSYVRFKSPVSHETVYYRQRRVIYGERRASKSWQNSLAKFLKSKKFAQGDNVPSLYLNADLRTTIASFVDDLICDGEQTGVEETMRNLHKRFDIKEIIYLTDGVCVDYLGSWIINDDHTIYICMHDYIARCLEVLNLKDISPVSTPIDAHINSDSPPLSKKEKAFYMTATGMIGWLANTVRIDLAYVFAKLSQHLQSPSQDAMRVLVRAWGYIKGTRFLALKSDRKQSHKEWKFFCDTDNGNDPATNNERRAMQSMIAMMGDTPVFWRAGVSKTCFANPKFVEAHADDSTTANEYYGLGQATKFFLGLQYEAEEAGLDFPSPFTIFGDNKGSVNLSKGIVKRSRLVHVDNRQCWVKQLRDQDIVTVTHIPGPENWADINTKVLPKSPFQEIRSHLLHELPERLRRLTPA